MKRLWLATLLLLVPALAQAMTWQEFWGWIVRYLVMKAGGHWDWT